MYAHGLQPELDIALTVQSITSALSQPLASSFLLASVITPLLTCIPKLCSITHHRPGDASLRTLQLVIMDTLVARYTQSPFADEGYSSDEQNDFCETVPPLSLKFALPPVPRPSAFLRAATDDYSNPNCPIKIAHGTTTLAFRFKGGIIVATDSRATAGNWIASQTVKKVIEINPMLLGTMAGGAAVGYPPGIFKGTY